MVIAEIWLHRKTFRLQLVVTQRASFKTPKKVDGLWDACSLPAWPWRVHCLPGGHTLRGTRNGWVKRDQGLSQSSPVLQCTKRTGQIKYMVGSQATCFSGFCGQGAFSSVWSLSFIQPCRGVPGQARVDTAPPGAVGTTENCCDLGLDCNIVSPQASQQKGHSVNRLFIGDQGAFEIL